MVDASGDILAPPDAAQREQRARSEVYVVEESQRPGSYMPMEEDEHGTYVMNSKSPYYVARTAQTYRQAIDDAVASGA